MNIRLLNTVHLDGAPIIKKGSGGGGGVTINNQSKSVDIVENGTTEIVADSGYTGLDKVTINTNVASSGGGSDMPVIGDGKTYLYIKIAEKGRMNVMLNFSQTVANGVTIDWGDGSATQTSKDTGNTYGSHTYADVGEYTISLNPDSGCTLGLGSNSYSSCVMGSTENYGRVYCNMLQAVEIGKNVTSIGKYAFYYCSSLASVVISQGVTSIGNYAFNSCYSLASIVIPDGVTSIGDYAFSGCLFASIVIPNSVISIGDYAFSSCKALKSIVIPNSVTSMGKRMFQYCASLASVVISNGVTSFGESALNGCSSLASVVIPEGVTSIGDYAFYECYSLASIVIPSSVTSIGTCAFYCCYGMAYYDFRASELVPTLEETSVFYNILSDCKIVVPDDLYDTWIAETNWSNYASKIIKASEFNG